jgi:valyl-tRNA synthetase
MQMKKLIDLEAEKEIEFVQSVITAIRNIRGEMNIPPSKEINLFLRTEKITTIQEKYIKSLTKVKSLKNDANLEKPKASASAVVKGCDIFIPLEGLVDLDVERARMEKEIARLTGLLTAVEKKLANENFVKNAPEEIVEKEKQKKADWELSLNKLNRIYSDLG